MSSCGVVGWGLPKPGDPNNNSVLQAKPAFGGIELSWTLPTVNPFAVAHTKIYRSTSDNFINAIEIATWSGDQYLDRVAHGTQYWYWIRHITVNGTPNELIGPASAEAYDTIENLLIELTGKIDAGVLANALRAEIDRIPLIGADIQNEITNRIASNEALSAFMNSLDIDVTQVLTLIQDEITQRTDGDATILEAVNTLAIGQGDNAALITEERNLRIAADSALAEDIDLMYTQVGTDISAAVQTVTQSYSDADEALASQVASMYATNESLTAAIQNEATVRANDIEAVSGTVESVQAQMDLNNQTRPGNTRGSSVNIDPMIENLLVWSVPAGITVNNNSMALGATGGKFFSAPPNSPTNAIVYENIRYLVNPDRVYSLTAKFFAAAGNDRNMYLFVNFFGANGAQLLSTPWGGTMSGYTVGGLPPENKFTRLGADMGPNTGRPIPVEAKTMSIGVWFRYDGTSEVEQAAQDIRLDDITDVRLVSAAVQVETDARVNADGALASRITSLETAGPDGSIAQVQENLDTYIELNDGVVTDIGAMYTVKTNVNGLIGGFGTYNDGNTVQMGFDVDSFFVGRTGPDMIKPFIIVDGVVYINQAVINELSVNKITSGQMNSEWRINGAGGRIVFDNGAIMEVHGLGFGANNNLIEWFGPSMPINQCTKANAVTYKATDGSAYYGGELRAGTLYNAQRTTQIAANAEVPLGPFFSNGNAKTVVVSYSYSNYEQSQTTDGNSYTANATPTYADIELWRSFNGGAATLVTTMRVNGSHNILNQPDGVDEAQTSMGGSTTYTDVGGVGNYTYTAKIVGRSLVGITHSSGGSTSVETSQSLGIVSTEV